MAILVFILIRPAVKGSNAGEVSFSAKLTHPPTTWWCQPVTVSAWVAWHRLLRHGPGRGTLGNHVGTGSSGGSILGQARSTHCIDHRHISGRGPFPT